MRVSFHIRLPVELRYMVYEDVLNNEHLIIITDNPAWRQRPLRGDVTDPPLWALSWTCKTIQREIMIWSKIKRRRTIAGKSAITGGGTTTAERTTPCMLWNPATTTVVLEIKQRRKGAIVVILPRPVSWELRQRIEEAISTPNYLSDPGASNFVEFTKNKVEVLNAQVQAGHGYPLWLAGTEIVNLYFGSGPIDPIVIPWRMILTKDMIRAGAWYGRLVVLPSHGTRGI